MSKYTILVTIFIHLFLYDALAKPSENIKKTGINHKDVVKASGKVCEKTKKLTDLSMEELKDWGYTEKTPVFGILDKVGVVDLSGLKEDQRILAPKGAKSACKPLSTNVYQHSICNLCNENTQVLKIASPSATNPNKYQYVIDVPAKYEDCEKKFNSSVSSTCARQKDLFNVESDHINYDPREYTQTSVLLYGDLNDDGIPDVSREGELCLLSGFANKAEQESCRKLTMQQFKIRIPSAGLSIQCGYDQPIKKTFADVRIMKQKNDPSFKLFEVCEPSVREVELKRNRATEPEQKTGVAI